MLHEAVRGLVVRPLLHAANSATKTMIPRRGMVPICGPPKTPITTAEIWLLGVGSTAAMMIPILYGMYKMPTWAKQHKKPSEQ